MRLPLFVLANLLIATALLSQSIEVPKESINVIESFEGDENDCNLNLSISNDQLILLDENQKEKLFVLETSGFELKECNNPFLLDHSIFLEDKDIYGFAGQLFYKTLEGSEKKWNRKSQNAIISRAIHSNNNSIIVLSTGIMGSSLQRINSFGKSIGKLSLESNQMCSYKHTYQHINGLKDGSLILVGFGLDYKLKNIKNLIITKLDADFNKLWDKEIICSADEKINQFFINEDIINIVSFSRNLRCKGSQHRLISFDQKGEVLYDKCLQSSWNNNEIGNSFSKLDIESGFLIKELANNVQGSTSFTYFDSIGDFQFNFTIPFQSVCDFELINENLIFTADSKLQNLNLESLDTRFIFSSKNDLEYNIFPNPSKDYINIKWGEENVVYIYSSLGVLIDTINLANGIGKFEIKHLHDGVFFVADKHKTEIRKFVKASIN